VGRLSKDPDKIGWAIEELILDTDEALKEFDRK